MGNEWSGDATAREHGPDFGNDAIPAFPVATRVRAAAASGVRALLVLETPFPAPPASEVSPPDRADRLAGRLGTENPRLVHDATRGLDAALLAAEAGTVPGGGLLILRVPPLERWGRSAPHSRFDARFARLLLGYLDAEPATSVRMSEPRAPSTRTREPGPRRGPPPAPSASEAALDAQDSLLRQALAHLDRDERALVVIEAPRGHGKSALLGRLAARLSDSGSALALCAARRSAVDVLERHRSRDAGRPSAPPLFLAPDAALARGGDTLLLDEAASVPLPLIEKLLGRWRRVVLASTSVGYESAGRAFALRLPTILDRERPGWLRLTPPVPMRWRQDDPLDALLSRVILTNASPLPPSAEALATLPTLMATRVDRDALVADEPRLGALFGLLSATHYQSTPLDLRHLLDGADMVLWSIEHGGSTLGTALVAIEPGVPPPLHADVLARRRRLEHRLLPQLLAQSANTDRALTARFARVVRIAVHPLIRRRGLGRRLVDAIVRDPGRGVEAVGASFGETPASAAFWARCGFTPFHRGYRRNPRSGQRAVAVLRAASPDARRVLVRAASIHADNERAERAGPARADELGPSTACDTRLLERFARGERSLLDTRAALHRLVRDEHAAHPSTDGRAIEAPGAAAASGDDAAELLAVLGIDAPPARKGREARVRDWVRERLARTG